MKEKILKSPAKIDEQRSGNQETPLWTVDDVASYLKLKPETVRGLARGEKIPAIKVGRVWRFQQEQIKLWVKVAHSYFID